MVDQPARKRAADVAAKAAAPSDEALSPSTTLEIDCASPDGRRRYAGSFQFKVPSLGDRIDIDVLAAKYLQQMKTAAEGYQLARMIAYLAVTISTEGAPEWWTKSKQGLELYDYQPVVELYARAVAYEARFCGGPAVDAGDRDEAEGEPAAADPGDVGGRVRPPAQRREVIADLGARGPRARPDDEGGEIDAGEEAG